MSGEALREATKAGDHAQLLELLKGGANPCSTDAHGLTALMHAVWNGHLESAKVLCANQNGRAERGHKSSSINIASTAGYTALHLAVLHCPMSLECMRMLLMFGADRSLRDSHGCTPLELALKEDKPAEAELLQSYDSAGEDIEAKRQVVRSKYFVQPTRPPPNPAARKALFKSLPFPLAQLLPRDSEKEKVPPTPPMVVHAHHLKPVCEQATRQLRGRELLWCLELVSDESEHEVARRYNITRSAQTEFADLVRKEGEAALSNCPS